MSAATPLTRNLHVPFRSPIADQADVCRPLAIHFIARQPLLFVRLGGGVGQAFDIAR